MEHRHWEKANLTTSLLGYGCMRFPTLPDGGIDEARAEALLNTAREAGVNYFDTAYPYHGGKSEPFVGRVIAKWPRESFYLADKFPGHQIAPSYDVKGVFEKQLKKCGVEYFDFYLLHNVYENSIAVYEDERWNILPYLLEQKKNGRIRHLGFSTHAGVPALEAFLEKHANEMEFCQIELNYLDWTLQQAKEKCELLNRYGIPIWVMEPVRGGYLATIDSERAKPFLELEPQRSIASWAIRWVESLPQVAVVLSGMSDLQQLEDNVATMTHFEPMNEQELAVIDRVVEEIRKVNEIPCTGCRYCMDCPMGVDIPEIFSIYSQYKIFGKEKAFVQDYEEVVEHGNGAEHCVRCMACTTKCPQMIAIPDKLEMIAKLYAKKKAELEAAEAAK